MLIVTSESHLDHNLTTAQLAWVLKECVNEEGFFIKTFTLPASLGTVECGLYGPIMGDAPVAEEDVHYTVRGNRHPIQSRMVKLGARKVSALTVIGGPNHGCFTCGMGDCILYTTYGGPVAPREPGDAGLKTDAERAEAAAFWAVHALAG